MPNAPRTCQIRRGLREGGVHIGFAGKWHTNETNEMDDLFQDIEELAGETRKIARKAKRQYSAEVEALLKPQSRDSRRIERCLDSMPDFCFDNEVLALYKKLCRYYFTRGPEQGAVCHELETRIAKYKAAIKKETQFN